MNPDAVFLFSHMSDERQRYRRAMHPKSMHVYPGQLGLIPTGSSEMHFRGPESCLKFPWIGEALDGAAWHDKGPRRSSCRTQTIDQAGGGQTASAVRGATQSLKVRSITKKAIPAGHRMRHFHIHITQGVYRPMPGYGGHTPAN